MFKKRLSKHLLMNNYSELGRICVGLIRELSRISDNDLGLFVLLGVQCLAILLNKRSLFVH